MQAASQAPNVTISFYIVMGRMGAPDRVYRSSEATFEFVNPAVDKNLLVGEKSFFLPFVRVRKTSGALEYANTVMPCHFSPDWSSIEAYQKATGTKVILDADNSVNSDSISKTSTVYWVALTPGQIFEVKRPSMSNIAIFKPTPWRAPVRKSDVQHEEMAEAA